MENATYAYAAGYIDGDGCFCISTKLTYSLSVSTIHKENAEWFKRNFEGTFSNRLPRCKGKHEIFTFRFNVKGLQILPKIETYLVEKQKESILMRKFADIFFRKDKKHLYDEMKVLKFETNLITRSMKSILDQTEQTIIPTIEDFAYLAGFVDAECSLDILKRKQPRGGQYSYVAQIQCNNTKIPFFEWVAKRFGGNFYFLNTSKHGNRRNQMIWRLRGRNCYDVLRQISPFLNHKKRICDEILKLSETDVMANNAPSQRHPRFMEFFEPIRQKKELIYQTVCQFNHSI